VGVTASIGFFLRESCRIADAIVVHIFFHEFFRLAYTAICALRESVVPLANSHPPHSVLRLIMALEKTVIYRNPLSPSGRRTIG